MDKDYDALIAEGNRLTAEIAEHLRPDSPDHLRAERDDYRREVARLAAVNAELLAALKQCLPIVNAYRKQSGGDGDITAMTARAALARAERKP
jgi:hypothetical protein